MIDELHEASSSLQKRGVIIGSGADVSAFNQLSRAINRNIGEDFTHLYSTMNGFSYDQNCFFRLWSIKEIIEEREKFDKNLVVIGDFLVDSDYIISEIDENQARVSLLHEERLLSRSIRHFVIAIASGQFDFLK